MAIEREGVSNPRKDLRKWSGFRPVYGYFFLALFEPASDPADARLGGIDPAVLRRLCPDLLDDCRNLDDADAWFGQIRAVAANGFAASVKECKATLLYTLGLFGKRRRRSGYCSPDRRGVPGCTW